jgi:hypothetical protein
MESKLPKVGTTIFTVVTPMQHALADFMESKPDYFQYLSDFYETSPEAHLLRFCFAKDQATLEEAAARLCKL